jgi:Beta-lactamase superfamily domain
VGPPWSKRQNGFVFAEPHGVRLYYEPHCDFEEGSVQASAPVDVVITPVVNQNLFSYPLVGGNVP